MSDLPDPPAGISAEAAELWTGFLEEMDEHDLLPDARELAILRGAVRHLTLAGRLEEELAATASVMTKGSRGNDRVTPLVAEIGKARAEVRVALVALKPPATKRA